MTIYKGGTPLWCPRSRGISSPSGTKLPRKKLEHPGYHTVKTRSLYLICMSLNPYRVVTDRRTDRQTDRQTDGQTEFP